MSIIDVYLLFVWYGIKENEEGYVYIFEIYVLKKMWIGKILLWGIFDFWIYRFCRSCKRWFVDYDVGNIN